MNRVVKYDVGKHVVVEKTLFKSGVLADCCRYVFSSEDKKELVVLNYIGDIVDIDHVIKTVQDTTQEDAINEHF